MRLGLIARADNTGLGVQTLDLYKHLRPHRTFIIDLTDINAAAGKQTGLFLDRYTNFDMVINGFPDEQQCLAMLEDIDVLLSVEIPYNYELFRLAKAKGVKTVLQYNYEFLDYLNNEHLPFPDLLLAPSPWHLEDVRDLLAARDTDCQLQYLPVPVNRQLIPYRQRSSARHFVHVAGHKTFMDRNGTAIVLAALPYVKSDIRLTIHSQHPLPVPDLPWLEVIDTEVKDYQDIYNNPNYDVMLLPRRYGGLSLQLNEALSAGLPVIMPDVPPNDHLLPPAALIETHGSVQIQTRAAIDCYDVDPRVLAAKIDELASSPLLVGNLSRQADEYAESIAWSAQRLNYIQRLEALCRPK